MSSIGVLLPSEDPVLHKIDGSSLVTQNGTYLFTKLVQSKDFSDCLANSVAKTTLIIKCEEIEGSVSISSFENSVASMVLKQILEAITTNYTPDISVCNVHSNREIKMAHDEYSHIFSDEPVISAAEALESLESPMLSAIRATIIDSRYQIIEVKCSPNTAITSLTSGVGALLHAVTTQANYVPYRENILTKLLWPSIQDPSKALTTIICIPTNKLQAQQPLLNLSSEIYSWINTKVTIRSFKPASLLSGTQAEFPATETIDEIKAKVIKQLDLILTLYTTELRHQSIAMMKDIQESKMETVRSVNDLKRSKKDEIDALHRTIRLLEAQISVFSKDCLASPTTSPEKSWFKSELDRKQHLLAELKDEESELLEKIAASRNLEVVEPFKGLIRQTEFNLNSLKLRLECLKKKSSRMNGFI